MIIHSASKLGLLFLIPAHISFYPTAIIAATNHVHTYFDGKKANYYFIAQQTTIAP